MLMMTLGEEPDTAAGVTPLLAAVSGLRSVAVPQGNHMALLERPDDTAPHLLDFLEEVQRAPTQ